MREEKKILLFGYQDPGEILRAAAAAKSCGAAVRSVPREGWGQILGELAAGKPVPPGAASAADGGRMLVLCGLEAELDALLPALRRAGVAGLRAVLTDTNRRWTARRLYQELEREHRAARRPPS